MGIRKLLTLWREVCQPLLVCFLCGLEAACAQGKAPGLCRLLRFNRPEWHWLLAGLVGSAGVRLIMPAFALSLSNVIAVLFSADYGYMTREARAHAAQDTCCEEQNVSMLEFKS